MSNTNTVSFLPHDEGKPIIIAGPCSAETEEQTICTAKALAAQGVKIFRAGVWKPRTKPGCFEGNGDRALPWLSQVKKDTGMLIATEVATPQHVEAALNADIDILWIGARTTTNPFDVQQLADALKGTNIPVLVKNPINPDVELWTGAIERLRRAHIYNIGVIHRGFSCYVQNIYRYQPLWQIPIELKRRMPELPFICDPSHMGGKRSLVASLSQEAINLGMGGLMIECHCSPNSAWSDSLQQITPETFAEIISKLVIKKQELASENISVLRKQIDDIDFQIVNLLAQRMDVCRKIGQFKKDNDLTIVHNNRYSEIIENMEMLGKGMGIGKDCVKHIFEEIHQESIRQQIEIINKNETKEQ